MLGVGVGFDTKGAGSIMLRQPRQTSEKNVFVIPDSREGAHSSLSMQLNDPLLPLFLQWPRRWSALEIRRRMGN